MGYMVLTDSQAKRAVLFCTTSERALDHEAFIGYDAEEQAENFLDWLGCDPRDDAGIVARGFASLSVARDAWHQVAFVNDEYVGA